VTVDGFYRTGISIVGITGVAENTTDRDLKMCAVYFDVLDKEGVKVADALASSQGLAARQKWRFQAVFTNPFSTQFELIKTARVMVLR